MDYYDQAKLRVESNSKLEPFKDILLYGDWDESEHYEWVATENESLIIDWAEAIRELEEKCANEMLYRWVYG